MKEGNNKVLSDAPPEEKSTGHSPFQIPDLKRENTLGSKIAEARKKNGLSQLQVAAALGQYGYKITDAALCQWEKGSTYPGGLQLLALCDILNIRDPLVFFADCSAERFAEPAPDLNQDGLELLQSIRESLVKSGQFPPDIQGTSSDPSKL